MLTYSLLVPTRKRPLLFREFIDSVNKCTKDKSRIDLNIIVDDDDMETIGYVKAVLPEYPELKSEIHYIKRQNTVLDFNLNRDYYNATAHKTKGDMIWIMADDLEICSYGWDEKVEIEVTNFTVKFPDKMFCVSILDNTKPPSHRMPKFPCFPMFTRECAIGLEGWYLHPGIRTWGADYISYCIFQPIDRLLFIHDKNYLNHKSFHTNQTGVDDTNEWIGHVFNMTKMIDGQNGMPYTDTVIDRDVPHIRNKLVLKAAEIMREKSRLSNQS